MKGRKRFALSRRTENKRERVPWVTDTPMGSCTRRRRLFGGTGACVRACASSKLVSFLRCLTGLPRKRRSRTIVHPSPRRRHQGLVDAGGRRYRTQHNASRSIQLCIRSVESTLTQHPLKSHDNAVELVRTSPLSSVPQRDPRRSTRRYIIPLSVRPPSMYGVAFSLFTSTLATRGPAIVSKEQGHPPTLTRPASI